MPSKSKQQQKFMGMVHALQKGDMNPSDASPELKKVANRMDKDDAKDYASTSHKGLPKKVKQEIVKKLKEYATKMGKDHMGGDSIPSAKKGGLRDFDGYDNVDYNKDMPMDEGKLPNNWMSGRTSDYHTKLRGKEREYDDTNFEKDNSGQPDLEEGFNELEHLKLLNLAMRTMPGSPKQKEIIKKLNKVRVSGGMKPLKEDLEDVIYQVKKFDKPKDEKLLTIKVINKLKDKRNKSKSSSNKQKIQKMINKIEGDYKKGKYIKEYGQGLDLSYLEDEDARLDGTPEPKDAIDRNLDETMIRRAVDLAQELLPKDTWSRYASDGKKNAEFVKNIVKDLARSLNQFYKNHNINVRIHK